jgi:hypothetical protein
MPVTELTNALQQAFCFTMVLYTLTPFTGTTNDPKHLKSMMTVKAPLQMVYDGKMINLHLHVQDFTKRTQNLGLFKEFQIKMDELPPLSV